MAASELPTSMLACQVLEFGQPYVLHEIPVPSKLGPHDLLLRVAAASLCHTDSMVLENKMAGTKLPVTASHEGCGTVVALGSEVHTFKLGDRVLAGIPRNRCGVCADCASPDEQYCQFREGGIGLQVDGAFAEYLLVDSRNSSLLPDKIDFVAAAPLACAGITAWRGLAQANLKKGQHVGIIGSGGGLGHLAIAFAKAQGLQVVGVDARDEGLKLSLEAGADFVFDAREGVESITKMVREATNGVGVAASINLSEAATAAYIACSITAKHGHMIQIAQPQEISIPYREIIFRNIHVSGSLTGNRNQVKDMLNFVAEHRIPVKTVVYNGLKEIPTLVDDSHHGRINGKGVVLL